MALIRALDLLVLVIFSDIPVAPDLAILSQSSYSVFCLSSKPQERGRAWTGELAVETEARIDCAPSLHAKVAR